VEPGATSTALAATAATIGVVHTLLGPDHYLPFVALARARSWSLARTWAVTAVCGAGHVFGSVVLGAAGIAGGWALSGLVDVEELRGELAGWLLLGFGVAYLVWGIRQGIRRRPHAHVHAHADGTVHQHGHDHRGAHAHPHDAAQRQDDSSARSLLRRWLGPWTLFVIFVLGPCEPLIPILMYPAATGRWLGVAAVALVFAAATIGTMLAVVTAGVLGLGRLPVGAGERWSHALAGAALAACGLAVTLGF
jgi:ABC-type nickel/cobalt efflux system permease component RcnA